jgi:hypothetical protein
MVVKAGYAPFAKGRSHAILHKLNWRAASILACFLTLCLSCTTTVNRPSDPQSVAVFAQFKKVRDMCGRPGTAELNYSSWAEFFRETKRTPWEPEPLFEFDAFKDISGKYAPNGARVDFPCFARAGDQLAAHLIIVDLMLAEREPEALIALEAEALTYRTGSSKELRQCRDVSMPIAFHCPFGLGRTWYYLGELRYKLNRDRVGAAAAFDNALDLGLVGTAYGRAAKIRREIAENPK